ncbi:hypothetical protein CP973_35670 [Streptomyces albofaciens JCM 4342]|uniref:hypothetical protein n=1 Tax=Streptomyces albofaciens TaxID=66866 RepID=UPI001238C080|nr:hypothetical protein [Streptomyces albofaciens]KAA6214437.1 hypothetical protein CP973_35670 [Streptomyces albofaciens JCM 4342]
MSAQGGGAGGARWNDEEQRWESGSPVPAPYTSPPPTKPGFLPGPGSPQPPGADFYTDETAAATNPPPYPLPTAPPSASPPATRPRTWSTPVAVGAAVAVVAAGFGGGWLLWGGDDTTVRSDARTSASPTAPTPDRGGATAPPGVPSGATDTPPYGSTASGSPSGALPSGYRLARDSAGFSIAVPQGWQRTERKDGVFYTAPDERYLLQVFEITEPDITPREALQATSRDLAGKPGYVQMSLGPVTDIGLSTGATELVYAYDSEKLGVRARVTDRAFTVPDGRQFAVLVLGPDADWPAQARIQQTALQHFSPSAY